jgi:enoyl-CoA hydratase
MGISLERSQGIAVMTLDHGRVNTLDTELCDAIVDVCAELAHDDSVRAVILTGAGKAFSAGVDLKQILSGGASYTRHFVQRLSACFLAVYTLPKPTVAAVNGHAIAGGCVLACACDRVLAASGTGKVGLNELQVGVPFPASALEIMRARLGRTIGTAVLDARTHHVARAAELGFVDELVAADLLLEETRTCAGRLAKRPTATSALTKRQLQAPVLAAIERAAATHDAEVADIWSSAEIADRIGDFLQRKMG